MLFDAHCHLNHDRFDEEERQDRINRIEEDKKLAYVMDVAFDLASAQLSAKHSGQYGWCFGAVGFHPHSAKDMGDIELALIRGLAKKNGIKAIGEIGLDFHYDNSPREKQRECFRKQIRLANELKMPIVIHSREADQEVLEILKEEGAFSDERKAFFPKRETVVGWESCDKDARVMLHCYSGARELAEQYVRLGGTISIAGPVTYKNNKKTVKVVEAIPLEFLMAETDAPFLTPEPFRGKPNYSSYVEHTVRRIGIIKGADYQQVEEQTYNNAKHFFGIEVRGKA